jgi:hypothetical protein
LTLKLGTRKSSAPDIVPKGSAVLEYFSGLLGSAGTSFGGQ